MKMMTVADQEQYALEHTAAACKAAKAKGLNVIEARRDQLFVDIDSQHGMEVFNQRVQWLKTQGIAKSFRTTVSKSGNWHGFVELTREMPIVERIALQSILGSDLVHEFCTYVSQLYGGEHTKILFFEVPEKEAVA